MVNFVSGMKRIKVRSLSELITLPAELTDNCILHTGMLFSDGYGAVFDPTDRKIKKAHRISYCIYNSLTLSAIADRVVMHKCDTPSCINPLHLQLGTVLDNNADRQAKGRSSDRRGANCPTAKLTPALVREIRVAHGTCIQIGKRYGVSAKCVNNIQRRITWQNVD
jgi:hypothetical protein